MQKAAIICHKKTCRISLLVVNYTGKSTTSILNCQQFSFFKEHALGRLLLSDTFERIKLPNISPLKGLKKRFVSDFSINMSPLTGLFLHKIGPK